MPARGPAARPGKLKLLEGRGNGRDSGGRLVPPAPEFRRVPPTKPVGLSPVASEHWDLVLPELLRLELVKAEDAGSLAQLCEAYATWHEARAIRVRSGVTMTTPTGRLVAHPAVGVERAASADYRNWAREFGLTPSAESRIQSRNGPEAEDNPFASGVNL